MESPSSQKHSRSFFGRQHNGLQKFLARKEAVDWLYTILWVFTHLYMVGIAAVFFLRRDWLIITFVLDVLQEPYFAMLGVYVVLKEIRKIRRKYLSQYRGELFVLLWAILLGLATLVTLFSPYYHLGSAYKLIVVSSVVSLIVLIGSRMHLP